MNGFLFYVNIILLSIFNLFYCKGEAQELSFKVIGCQRVKDSLYVKLGIQNISPRKVFVWLPIEANFNLNQEPSLYTLEGDTLSYQFNEKDLGIKSENNYDYTGSKVSVKSFVFLEKPNCIKANDSLIFDMLFLDVYKKPEVVKIAIQMSKTNSKKTDIYYLSSPFDCYE